MPVINYYSAQGKVAEVRQSNLSIRKCDYMMTQKKLSIYLFIYRLTVLHPSTRSSKNLQRWSTTSLRGNIRRLESNTIQYIRRSDYLLGW